MTDPYVYPGTEVLKNKCGIRDPDKLWCIERLYTRHRLKHLPDKIDLSYAGYKALHRHIFQDVYNWAGEVRTINLTRRLHDNQGVRFLDGPFVDVNLRRFFGELRDDDYLRGLDRKTFAYRAAVYMADLNYIHPFREGNGRTQRVFLKQLAEQAGYKLDLRRIRRAQWLEASRRTLEPAAAGILREQDYRSMTAVIEDAMRGRDRPRDGGRERDRGR